MSTEELISKIKKAADTDPNKEYIKSISLFGSYLHGDSKHDSDVDLLFEPKKRMGYFKLFAIQNRLSETIGRPVELLTKEELSKYFRVKILKEAKKIYQND